jgi:hypothetical protein
MFESASPAVASLVGPCSTSFPEHARADPAGTSIEPAVTSHSISDSFLQRFPGRLEIAVHYCQYIDLPAS